MNQYDKSFTQGFTSLKLSESVRTATEYGHNFCVNEPLLKIFI